MAQNILGIDIGTFSVKVALIERRVREFYLVDFVEQALNPASRLPHEEQATLTLEQILSTRAMRADVICMSLSGHIMSSRILDVPATQPKKIAEGIEFELEGYVPMPMEDLHFDHHVLSSTENSSRVLCVYMQAERFGRYMDAFARAGIEPKYVAPDVTDLAGIAAVGMVPLAGRYILCDLGHSKTNICIMDGKELRYVRTIGLGGNQFTRAIQRAFNLNAEKADALKISRGKLSVREEDTDQVARILTRVAGDLVSQIKQTIMAFQNQYGHKEPILAMYVCGGTSKTNGMLDFLSFHLRLNVLELDVLTGINHSLENPDEVLRSLPQAVAAAMRPVFPTRIPRINLRKGGYAFKKDVEVIQQQAKTVGLLYFLIIILSLVYYLAASGYYSDRVASIRNKVDKITADKGKDSEQAGKKEDGKKKDKKDKNKASKDVLAKLDKAIKEIEGTVNQQKEQVRELAREGYVPAIKILEEISRNLPAKKDVQLQVMGVTYADDFVKITGKTVDYDQAGKIVEALKSSPLFAAVESKNEQKTKNNELKFDINITIEPLALAQPEVTEE